MSGPEPRIAGTAVRSAESESGLDMPPLDSDPEARTLYAAGLKPPGRVFESMIAASRAGDAEPSYSERQHAVLALLLAGLAAAFPDISRRRSYTAYHRDWLIRYPILTSGQGMAKVDQIFDLLETQARAAGGLGLDGLLEATRGAVSNDSRTEWADAVSALTDYLARFDGEPGYDLDPFAHGPSFPVLLRLFHAVARRFGLALLDEAALHHLIIRAAGAGDERDGFCLAPHLQEIADLEVEVHGDLAPSFEEGYSWPELVAVSSDEGREWVKRYHRSRREAGGDLHQALQLLRRGAIEEGRELLDRAEEYRQGLRERDEALYHVLGRFYHGENAYYLYSMGDLAGAYGEMDEAGASVRRAIEAQRFLLPLAPLVVDVPLQKARVARRERDWPAMARHLRVMYEMEVTRRPLCVLGDGTVVDYRLLEEHFRSLPVDEDDQRKVFKILDRKTRLKEYRRLTTKLYTPPGLIAVS